VPITPPDRLHSAYRTRSQRPLRRRLLLELENLEDRTLPSGAPLYSVLHPAGAGTAGSITPWANAFSPAGIAQAYGLNLLPSADNGAGQTIAVVAAYDNPKLLSSSDANFLNSDLHKFDVQYGLSEPAGFFTKVNQNGVQGSYPATDPEGPGTNNWEGEEALGVEWAHALAPGAHIILVEANDATTSLFTAANWAGTQSGAQVVAMGWGESEFPNEKVYDSSYFVQPGNYGVTYLAATGDGGAPGTYPAYSPSVVAVGGTTLTVDSGGNYVSETGWSNSGGGTSLYEQQPAFQNGVNQSSTLRSTPDVAFDADSSTPVSVYDSYNGAVSAGNWWQFSGTSVACPCWAALISITDQLRATQGLTSLSGPGQLMPMLYTLPASDFHDVSTGNNGNAAGAGYDQVTGLGTPVANKLVTDLAALRVQASTPTGGIVVTTAPTTFTLTFSDPVNPTSVHANALTVNGIAATNVALDSTHTIATFTFTSTPATGQGPQAMALAAGAITSGSGSSRTNAAFNTTFYYDTVPLAIASTTPTPGGSFSLPASSVTYYITFNQPIDPKFVKPSNLILFPNVATVTAATVMPGNQTVAYTLKGLTTLGSFTINIAANTFKDQYDDPLSPGNFTATYYAEQNLQALPTPLASAVPFGSQIYSTSATNQLLYAGDSDRFTIAADPGQTLTVLVTPTGFTPTVQVSDPSSTVLGSTAASGPGANALLQTVATTTSGTYTITVGGASGAIGNYSVQVYLNAALEPASQGFATDNTAATAQNLNPAFVTLQNSLVSATRAAVLGSVGQPVTVNASAVGNWDSTGQRTASAFGYEIGQPIASSPVQYNNFFVFNLASVNPTILSATLKVSADGYSSPLSSDTFGLFDVSTPITSLETTGVGQTTIFSDLGSGTSYGTKTITTSSGNTVLSIPLNTAAVIAMNNKHGGQFAIGGALTTLTGSSAQYLFAGSGSATDTVQLALTLVDTHFYSLSLAANEKVSVGLKNLTGTGDTISIRDGNGNTLASGAVGAGNVDQVINNFTAPAAGTYYVVVSGSTAATYSLVVVRDASWDNKTNASFSTAQDITATTGVMGALSSTATTDWYKVTLSTSPAQNSLQVETRIPLSGPAQAVDTLKPNIQLYNSSGNPIASGAVLPDGRNQSLLATGLTAGATYYIQVTPANGATGEYFLGVAPLATPVLTGNPANQSVYVGQPATFIAAASGIPAPTVQWQLSTNNGVTYTPILGATSPTFTIASASLSQNGSLYEAVFTNPAGTVTSAPATLSVQPVPIFTKYLVTPLISSSTITAGNSFAIQVQAADQFGNPMTSGYNGPSTVTVGLIPPSSASGFPFNITLGSSGIGWAVVSLVQVGTYTITATAGSFSGSSSPITVLPAAAAKLAFGTQPVNTPTGVTLAPVTVQVQDQFGNLITTDNTDVVKVGIASGPGGFMSTSTTSATVVGGVATFNNLIFIVPGTYQITEFVTGSYTGPTSTPFSIAPLQVLPGSFSSNPSGFALQFNAPYLVNSITPVLYGAGFGNTAPAPTLTLTQTRDGKGNAVNVPVVGSLVLNTATNSMTFVATDTTLEIGNNASPILPDGTYVLVLHSTAANDGFQALNAGGGFLDGLRTGVAGSGDYTATFTVNAAAAKDDVVWVPDVSQGPGQPLSAPGNEQIGGGYPVYLSDSTASVTNVQVTLNYNPAFLTVTGVTGAHFALLGTSTPGHAVLQYSGPVLPTGTQVPLGFITASVPAGTTASPMPYKAKDLLTLTGVSISGTKGAVPAVAANALHLVSYVGDADGNGGYSSNDAVLITRVALQTDIGFAAYPLVDPVVVADTDGAGFIPADAALQANEAGVGFTTANLAVPPIPSGAYFVPIGNNVDPALSVDRGPWTVDRSTLTVAVNIDDPHPAGSTGLIEGHLALTYDPRQLSVTAADLHLGSVLAASSGWSLVPTIDAVTGQIAIALSSTTPVTSTLGGSLVTIDFHVRPGVANASGSPGVALVLAAYPNGQYVATELEDAQGTFTLSPAPGTTLVTAITVTNPTRSADQLSVTPVEIRDSEPARPAAVEEPSVASAPVMERLDVAPVETGAAPSEDSALPATRTARDSGLITSFASSPWLNTPASALQHVADQLFQALGRSTSNSNDPMFVSPVREVFDHMLSAAWRLAPTPDEGQGGNGDDVLADLDWRTTADSLQVRQEPRRASREAKESHNTPAEAWDMGDGAARDQYFASAAEDDYAASDEE
jgi:Bacterial pre-peptidase C-terminal domain